jgi:hypothetical protein
MENGELRTLFEKKRRIRAANHNFSFFTFYFSPFHFSGTEK